MERGRDEGRKKGEREMEGVRGGKEEWDRDERRMIARGGKEKREVKREKCKDRRGKIKRGKRGDE